jgi:tetratricopeptide (TPR) repeat protein
LGTGVTTSQENTAAVKKWSVPVYLTSEPVLLAALSGLAVVFCLAVTGLSRLYHSQQDSLGTRWYQRGVADLNAKKYESAMLEFRTALRYSRDDYDYQLGLAQSLIGLQRTQEAESYLINLWDSEPENGEVNVALARIAAQKHDSEHALRYYHDAIYAAWPAGAEMQRRQARLELIEYLLKTNLNEQAQAELIALEANLGDDPVQQMRVGDLFMRAQDYEHALTAYKVALRDEHHDAAAEAGAGAAAFALGRYPLAIRYLQAAVTAHTSDEESANLLKMAELVVQVDPYQEELTVGHRDQIVLKNFDVAGERLKACGILPSSTGQPLAAATQLDAPTAWAELKPKITVRGLERDPGLVKSAMDASFDVERETSATCPVPFTAADQALLLISKLHEGR